MEGRGEPIRETLCLSLSPLQTFLQVLAISAVNTVCGLIYIYMQFFRISDFIIYLGSFLWVWAHGG